MDNKNVGHIEKITCEETESGNIISQKGKSWKDINEMGGSQNRPLSTKSITVLVYHLHKLLDGIILQIWRNLLSYVYKSEIQTNIDPERLALRASTEYRCWNDILDPFTWEADHEKSQLRWTLIRALWFLTYAYIYIYIYIHI